MSDSKYFKPVPDPPLISVDRLPLREATVYNNEGIASFPGQSGLGCTPTLSPRPARNIGGGEKNIQGTSNCSITLGVDRPGGLGTGMGGQGIPAATIDLCAGHMGAYARSVDDAGNPVLYNPNFQIDAARVYISELTDIDDAMKLPEGSIGNRTAGSAVGIMADNLNFQAQGEGGIKIAAYPTNRNSRGGKNLQNPGIDLIAGDGTNQQPIPLGDNLMEALKEMSKEVDEVRETVNQFVKLQGNFNDKIMSHNHNSPFYALTTAPSFNLLFEGFKQAFQRVADVETSFISNIVNKSTSKNNYFNPTSEKYILSALVKTS